MQGTNLFTTVTSLSGNAEQVALTDETASDKAYVRGATVPADGLAGYAKGCIFMDTNASAGAIMFVNEGSNTSCDFNSADEASTLAQSFVIESGTYDTTITTTTQTVGAATLTIPDMADVNDTFVFNAKAATLTDKTIALGSNTVSGTIAEFNTAVTDADFATLAGTETLTTKTIALGSNTISGTIAEFNTAVTDADFATLAGAETLTNKTIDADGTGNVITNVNADELDPIAATTGTYGVPFVITVVNAGAATNAVFTSDAPFKFRIIDVLAVSTKGSNSGTWKLDDGTNDITTAVAYDVNDTLVARVAAINDTYHDIASSGSLRLISSEATDEAIVYVTAIRVD